MSFRLTVAHGLAALGDVLADELAGPADDPFAPEVVVVPSDGVRAWLVDHLAQRLGSTGERDGVVANIEFLYPAQLVRRALGDRQASGRWSVGPLTWAVYEVLRADGSFGLPADLARARAVADLFDRYTLHRPAMVIGWEHGRDVDATGKPLAAHLRWQPQLWRRVVAHFGLPSDAAQMALVPTDLRTGRHVTDLPGRVALFGLSSLPGPHLTVLSALSEHVDVDVLAPVPSLAAWRRLLPLVHEPFALPLARVDDPSVGSVEHPLLRSWGASQRESALLLANAAVEVDARLTVREPTDDPPATMLGELQRALRADLPAGGERAARRGDPSLQWHRCHGLARQVEVLRDVVLGALDEHELPGATRFFPRDVLVLCPDPAAVAPMLEAAFAGNPADGVPAVPVRVADRSLRSDRPLLDAVAALVGLAEGRFRASEVLGFLARDCVAQRLGLTADRLGRVAEWVEATHVHWGLDVGSREAVGLGDLEVSTWRAGLDQVLLGVATSPGTEQVGPGGVVAYAELDHDDMLLAGVLADALDALDVATRLLSTDGTVTTWCAAVREAARATCELPDSVAWQWSELHDLLDEFAAEAEQGGAAERVLPAAELASLFLPRLTAPSRRPVLRHGEVTVSSLTSHRGVPARIVCVFGLDDDTGGEIACDDVMAVRPCIGDRDARSEQRAQLLDAVLAAGDRLVLLSNGHDVRSNAPVAPPVALAELAGVLDATFGAVGDVPASRLVAVDHPRQAWSDANFEVGRLVPDRAWSFDASACAAALRRRAQDDHPALVSGHLPVDVSAEVGLADLELALKNPIRLLLQRRLGVRLVGDDGGVGDLPPLALDPLDEWKVTDALVRRAVTHPDGLCAEVRDEWAAVLRARGAVPPRGFGEVEIDELGGRAEGVFTEYASAVEALGVATPGDLRTESIQLTTGDRTIVGELAGVFANAAIVLTTSRVKPDDVLLTWLRSAVLTVCSGQPCSATVVGRPRSGSVDLAAGVRVSCRSVEAAHQALEVVLAVHDAARSSLLATLPALTVHLAAADDAKARNHWDDDDYGARRDRWVSFALGHAEFDDLLAEPTPDAERYDGEPSRLRAWAKRLWGTLGRTADVDEWRIDSKGRRK